MRQPDTGHKDGGFRSGNGLWRRGAMLVTLLAFVAVGVGCSSGNKSMVRGLKRSEMDELVAMKQVASAPAEPKAPQSAAQLEASADRLAMTGEWSAALVQYSRGIAISREAGEQRRLETKSGAMLLRLRQYSRAEDVFGRLSTQTPENAAVWQGLGLSRLRQGKMNQAVTALRRAVELNPEQWSALNALGVALNRQGQPAEALRYFDRALTLAPARADIHNNRAMALMMSGRKAAAEKDLRKALSLKPGYKLAQSNLALLYAGQERWNQALKLFSASVGRPAAHNNLGSLMARRGDWAGAAEQFRKAIEASPTYYPEADRRWREARARLGAASLSPTGSDGRVGSVETSPTSRNSLAETDLSGERQTLPTVKPQSLRPESKAKPATPAPAATKAPVATKAPARTSRRGTGSGKRISTLRTSVLVRPLEVTAQTAWGG